jgi:predicted DNA-binding ribbon-helix-helix protein
MPKELKRSITISGHRTSISLEPEFWTIFAALAEFHKKSIATLVGEIDQTRGARNLSSAIRVWVLLNKPN